MIEENPENIAKVDAAINNIVAAFLTNRQAHEDIDQVLDTLSQREKEGLSIAQNTFDSQSSQALHWLKETQQQVQTARQFLKQADVWYLDEQVQIQSIGRISETADSFSKLQALHAQANTAFQILAELTDSDRGPWVTIEDKPLGISTGVVRFDSRIGYGAKTVQLRNNVDCEISIDRRIGPYWAFIDLGRYDDPRNLILKPGETVDVDILVGLWPPRQIRQRFTMLGDSQIEIRAVTSAVRFYIGLGMTCILILYHLSQVINWIENLASPNLNQLLFGTVFMSFIGAAFSAALLLAWFSVTGGLVGLLLSINDTIDRVNSRFIAEPISNGTSWIKRITVILFARRYLRSALDSLWLNVLLLIPVAIVVFLGIGLPIWFLLSIVAWLLTALAPGLGPTLFTFAYLVGVGILTSRWLQMQGYTFRGLSNQIQQDISDR